MARSDVDVDALIRIGRKRRVVGASYATEKREVFDFDPELKKLAASLAKALPDTPLINLIGTSCDENRTLLIAGSDTQTGMVDLYDKDARSLERLLPVRMELADKPMGKMQPATYPAADGTQIPAYLTLPPGSDGKGLRAVVMPRVRPAARDEWGFDWLVQYFTACGYAVLQPNYRGSSGYGEAWYGRSGFKASDVAIAPVSDLGYLVDASRDYTRSRLVQEFAGKGPHVEAGSPHRHADRFAAPVALLNGTRDLNVDVRHAQAMESAL